MANYSVPEFQRQVVNRAGKTLVAGETDPFADGLADAREVVDNWRAAHAYPAQVIYMTVKRNARKLGRQDGVAQRIKRMPSIIGKPVEKSDMKLSQMQDIAGVRSVLKNLNEVYAMERALHECRWAHERLEPKDYIQQPKDSGYRGIHLKYRFKGEGEKQAYNNLKVEIQLRTQLQHQWATAVEAADSFTKQSLKHSKGDAGWKRFFSLMGSIFAIKEGVSLVPFTPSTYHDIALEIYELDERLKIGAMFAGFATALLPHVEGDRTNARYFLVTLDPVERKARIKGFQEKQAKLAQAEYSLAESRLPPDSLTQVVLVSTSSIKALKRVYPNYFMDTVEFNKVVADVISDGALLKFGSGHLVEA